MGKKFKAKCPRCGTKSEEGCPLCKGKKELEYEMAGTESVGYLEPFVEQVLDAVAEATGCDGVRAAWVSDESEIGHFPVEDGHLEKISKALGFEVKEDDLVVNVAKKLKNL